MASIEERMTKNGARYRVRFRYQNRQIVRSFVSLKGAEVFRRLAEHSPEQALAAIDEPEKGTPLTFAEMVRAHIDGLTGIEYGTRSTYYGYVKRDIDTDPIGSRLARNLTTADARAWIRRLEDRGFEGKTIANRRGLVSAAYSKTAIPTGQATENPFANIRIKKRASTKEHLYLSREEAATLIAATPEPYRLLVMTLLATGMRISEALALQVYHFDAHGRSLRVEQSWKYTDGNGHRLGDPKSLRSTRTLALPSGVADLITAHVEGKKHSAYLFTTPRGHVIRRTMFRRDAWDIAIKAMPEGRRPRVHDLRHTFASWAIQAGIPLPVLQRQLGHESITTTVDTYGHLARSDFDALAGVIGGNLPIAPTPSSQAIEAG